MNNKHIIFALIMAAFAVQANAQCASNASGSPGSCLCNQGYYGTNAESNGTCNQCPTGTTTAAPSSASGGNTNSGTTIIVCSLCDVNYYMTKAAGATQGYQNTPAAALCNACPPGTGNSGASSAGDVSQCTICLPNYYMTALPVAANPGSGINAAAATCILCPDGSGNASGVNAVGNASQCNTCVANFYMSAAATGTKQANCQACPIGSGNASGSSTVSDSSVCNICQKNYFMTALASTGVSAKCSPCPSNSYSSGSTSVNSIASCMCFDSNAVALSSTITQCQCKNGFFGKVATVLGQSSGCKQCPKGQFTTAGANCNICTAGSTITTDQGGCTCNDSSTGTLPWNPATNVCECQTGYYGNPSTATTVGTTGSCTSCPKGTSSTSGQAQAASDCVQIPGATTYSMIIYFSGVLGVLALLI
ncbi:transmembrane protein, putative (macronuclear) [Tetrahymena thermophila SB210]|uniref:Transmembrane protein, putative n=1 Tax=Tetrahymena thermophila (strain SB210) TaxID=312017 RepID=I7ME49_TETTS|nr:transmembrane protein, putative [Tetrahymena thermophila SB210]EAR94936.1 transmembrane protein, putative [Tetrahymena thermophila SB210]|eukprot:XP_001015181.1 transmembrane protein, putative [Tetrahymena thermophila SB210]